MTDPSFNGVPEGKGPDGKFLPGHRFARGGAVPRAIQQFRTQIVRQLKMGRSIPRLVKRLEQLASGAVPIRLRTKKVDQATKKVTWERETAWMPVDPAVQVAAIKELLSRAVGKSTEFKVVQDVTPQAPVVVSVEAAAAVCDRLGIPPEKQPLEVQEWRKRANSRVLEPPPAQ